ncbi:ABC transporter substrate-binding protein [Gryllotalpicola reticulitermitis]|uniref:ABC transporter substrate-binding protein n=1 Tax=Gryllotalpicola reticulitermitis TaxID=1184153 RepID=A0ABV8Q978_9MICO
MRKHKALIALTIGAAVALVVSGCSSGGSTATKQDPKAPLTIWVDAARQPQAEAYAKAHPSEKITVDVIDATQGVNTQKISLAEKAGSGVPDVVFIGAPDEAANLAANPINYALPLNKVVPKNILDGFPTGVLSRCTFSGQIYCLGNDLGQTVLWYNKPLFQQWGYQVPTTFAQFEQLGVKLAKEHPGYNLGTINGRYGVDAFFGSSGCPVLDTTGVSSVKINTADPKCTRVGDVIGPLLANGTLSTLDLFDKTYDDQIAQGKVVAMVGASWTGDFAFKPMTTNSGTSFNAAGKYTAAPMPTWAGETTNWSGAVGGGIWLVSRTSKNQKAAVDFAIAMTTDPSIAKTQTTYPAYAPSAKIWLAEEKSNTWYASDPTAVLQAAASKINPAEGYTRYETQLLDSFNATVIKNGATNMSGALTSWGQQAAAAAKSAGYTVTK